MTTTPSCCREAPSTPTSCGSTRTRWRSSGPSPRQASPSRRSATARGRLSLRASSTAADSPPGPACAMTCAMPARSRSTSKSSSTASSPPAAPRRTCPPSARRSSSSSPAAGCQASHRRASAVPGDPGSARPEDVLLARAMGRNTAARCHLRALPTWTAPLLGMGRRRRTRVSSLDARRTLTCGYGLRRTGWTRRTDLRIRRLGVRVPPSAPPKSQVRAITHSAPV